MVSLDFNYTGLLVGINTTFFAICILLYGNRMYAHLRPRNILQASDYLITGSMILLVAVFCLEATAISFGFGHSTLYLDPQSKSHIQLLGFCIGLIGNLATFLARVSVAVMLLTFEISFTWTWILRIAIIVQFLTCILAFLAELLECHPLKSIWEPVPDVVCWPSTAHWNILYTIIGLSIICDLAFAIMPMIIIMRLPRSLPERLLITVLMALGFFAATMAGMRAYSSVRKNSVNFGDPMQAYSIQNLWCRLEEFALIAAACSPFLKTPLEKLLNRVGIVISRNRVRDLSTISDARVGRSHPSEGSSKWESPGNWTPSQTVDEENKESDRGTDSSV